mmetsp:Transcript_110597/g.308077  ORF Transcript_110597/g.308077 Transcript_110597/m.308077 type:complete len:350 (-) Transcript_110597:220-1269(-)
MTTQPEEGECPVSLSENWTGGMRVPLLADKLCSNPVAPSSTDCPEKAEIEPVPGQAVHDEIRNASVGAGLTAKLAKTQSVLEALRQERTRLVTELQLLEGGTTQADFLTFPVVPLRSPEPAEVPEPPSSWTLTEQPGKVLLAVGTALGQSQTTPETAIVAREPHAFDVLAPRVPKVPAEQNSFGFRRGAARAIQPLRAGVETLLVRNVPARFTQDELLKEWPPDGTFDFLYRPCSGEGTTVLGHAFVNFTSSAAAEAFQLKWHGKFFRQHGKGKALDVVGSTTQGFVKNMKAAFRKTANSVEDEHVLPAVFRGTERLDARAEAVRLGLKVPSQQCVRSGRDSSAGLRLQ